jgi:4-hydroxy-tetrahydrodipicolinate synthase
LIPELNLALYDAIQKSDLAAARQVFRRQLPLLQFLGAGGLPRTIAAGLELMGIEPGQLRAPLAELPAAEKDKLAAILRSL